MPKLDITIHSYKVANPNQSEVFYVRDANDDFGEGFVELIHGHSDGSWYVTSDVLQGIAKAAQALTEGQN